MTTITVTGPSKSAKHELDRFRSLLHGAEKQMPESIRNAKLEENIDPNCDSSEGTSSEQIVLRRVRHHPKTSQHVDIQSLLNKVLDMSSDSDDECDDEDSCSEFDSECDSDSDSCFEVHLNCDEESETDSDSDSETDEDPCLGLDSDSDSDSDCDIEEETESDDDSDCDSDFESDQETESDSCESDDFDDSDSDDSFSCPSSGKYYGGSHHGTDEIKIVIHRYHKRH